MHIGPGFSTNRAYSFSHTWTFSLHKPLLKENYWLSTSARRALFGKVMNAVLLLLVLLVDSGLATDGPQCPICMLAYFCFFLQGYGLQVLIANKRHDINPYLAERSRLLPSVLVERFPARPPSWSNTTICLVMLYQNLRLSVLATMLNWLPMGHHISTTLVSRACFGKI